MKYFCFAFLLLCLAFQTADAGETPIYADVPDWIEPTDVKPVEQYGADPPQILLYDAQARFLEDQHWQYFDTAVYASSPEVLAQLGTLTFQWVPDKGDLIIHELAIYRGDERIDLTEQGQKLEVLRREEALEQRELTGVLTGTLAVQGLRVGDVLRMRQSVTSSDSALGGEVQALTLVQQRPLRIGQANLRFVWANDEPVQWKALFENASTKVTKNGSQTELQVELPAPEAEDMPADAPLRFHSLPLIEFSSFSSWPEVSRTMAPLYDRAGLIDPEGPLAQKASEIMANNADPLMRAQRALQFVQDDIRYLAVGMDGGNYRPQSPADTWEKRYGDCKAKTLLLLALLDTMGISAEPVMVHASLGDLLPQRLPSVLAFNHILVRAVIGGNALWLDGTGSGVRLADIYDVPPFRYVLPLRPQGAELIKLSLLPNGRPTVDIAVEVDESTSTDLPSFYHARAVVRGAAADMLKIGTAGVDVEQKKEAVRVFFTGFFGEGQFRDENISFDPAAGTVELSATAASTSQWFNDEQERKRRIGRALNDFDFDPDRSAAAWSDIPVATPNPIGARYRLRLRLPDGGVGYRLEGTSNVEQTIAGRILKRSVKIEDGVVILEEQLDSTGTEIPVSEIGQERDRVATAQSNQPVLIAPDNTTRRWSLGNAPANATQLDNILSLYEEAIAADPDEVEPLANRISLLTGIGDYEAALKDLDRVVELTPDQRAYLQRAAVRRALGRNAAALADAKRALELDPSSADANGMMADLLARSGDLSASIALLDSRIALGGEYRDAYSEAKAILIGEYGDPETALELLNNLMERSPGNPRLLNASCWIKGTRSHALDTALKDCTRSIELSAQPYAALDSRSMVWFRLNRFDDALADLNAVLENAPALAASRFMRGVTLNRLGRAVEAKDDLGIARKLDPGIDRTYRKYGIAP